MKVRRPCNKSAILCFISVSLIILGIVLITSWSCLYDLITKTNMVLTPTSMAYQIWKQNPLPLTIDFYFHNWTNPGAVYNNTVKPKFVQMGPYKFTETKEKSNVTWNANNTVTFRHLRRWFFDEKNSVGPLTDLVTTLNPVSTSAAYAARDWNFIIKHGLSIALKTTGPKVHVTRTVGELLFEGYEDPLMNIAKSMPFLAGSNMPDMDKFGWFYGRNGSEVFEGTFNMDTGVKGPLGRLYEWRGSNRTDYYIGKCSDISGSAGEFFPANMNNETIIKFFSSDLCRPMELEFQKHVSIHNIVGNKYVAGDRFLDNGTKIPENKCFCLGDCMPSGAVNVSACRYGSPAFVSLPHFYNGDPYYQDSIEGVTSDSSRHEFYMIFEPKTGIPLEVAARLQLNLLLQPIESIELYKNVPKVYFPLIWFQQVVRMPEDMAVYIKLLLNFQVIISSIGILLIVSGLLIQFCFWYRLCTLKLCEREVETDIIIKERVPLNDTKLKL